AARTAALQACDSLDMGAPMVMRIKPRKLAQPAAAAAVPEVMRRGRPGAGPRGCAGGGPPAARPGGEARRRNALAPLPRCRRVRPARGAWPTAGRPRRTAACPPATAAASPPRTPHAPPEPAGPGSRPRRPRIAGRRRRGFRGGCRTGSWRGSTGLERQLHGPASHRLRPDDRSPACMDNHPAADPVRPFSLSRSPPMRLSILAVAAAATLAAPFASLADPATEGRDWHGKGELGLALTSGNTDSQTLNGKLGLTREDAFWEHAMGLSLLYGKQDGVESASRYEAFGKIGRRRDDRRQWSGSMRTERDHFAAYEYESAVSIGYSRELVGREATQLQFEIGPGYRWSKRQGVRVHENGAIGRGQLEFSHQLNPSTLVYDTLLIEAG